MCNSYYFIGRCIGNLFIYLPQLQNLLLLKLFLDRLNTTTKTNTVFVIKQTDSKYLFLVNNTILKNILRSSLLNNVIGLKIVLQWFHWFIFENSFHGLFIFQIEKSTFFVFYIRYQSYNAQNTINKKKIYISVLACPFNKKKNLPQNVTNNLVCKIQENNLLALLDWDHFKELDVISAV